MNGVVFDENDVPLAGVELSAIGVAQPVVSGVDGTFSLSASPYATHVEARCEGYLSARTEIDDSYIIFRMKVEKILSVIEEKPPLSREVMSEQEFLYYYDMLVQNRPYEPFKH